MADSKPVREMDDDEFEVHCRDLAHRVFIDRTEGPDGIDWTDPLCCLARGYLDFFMRVGEHQGCGGHIRVVDQALRCQKCHVQDWAEHCGPYDPDLVDHMDTMTTLRRERDELRTEIERLKSVQDI